MRDHKQSIKEVVRHVMHLSGLGGLMLPVRRFRGNKTFDFVESNNLEGAFESIYRTDVWLTEQGLSKSGAGSELIATAGVIALLKGLLHTLKCECLIDLGCGDFNWMQHVVANESFCYVGCDVVRTVVDRNIANYQSERIRFEHLNACESRLPSGDVIICREVLFHLSFEDIARLLNNIVSTSNARYFITTLDRSIWFNSNITSGDFRNINLLARPFSFPEPWMTIPDDAVRPGRALAVWEIDQFPKMAR